MTLHSGTVQTDARAPSRQARTLGTAVTVVVGVAMAAQARINGELAARIDDGMVAALLSFAGGLVLLGLFAALLPRMRRSLRLVGQALRDRRLRPYQLLGGLCGAFMVASQGLTVALIGVAVFTVAIVAGQAISGMFVDRAGLGPGGPQPFTTPRVAGALLAVAAVGLAVSPRLDAARELWPALLPALAGVCSAWQQAVNGRVAAAARGGGPPLAGMLPAALVNFVAGTTGLILVTGVEVALRGLPAPLPTEPWLYLGGPLGVLFIGAAAAVVPITGVLLLGLGTVAGQLVGALLIDLVAPAGEGHLTAVTVVGTLLALVAISVTALPARRRL